MKPLQSSGVLIAVGCHYSCVWVWRICLHEAWQVSCVYVRARAHALRWSGVPSVLQGRALFPGNWVVSEPGRSSQQWGGNTRCVSRCLSLARTKLKTDETSYVCACVRLQEKLHNAFYDESAQFLISKSPHPSAPSVLTGWQQWWLTVVYLACECLGPLFPMNLL